MSKISTLITADGKQFDKEVKKSAETLKKLEKAGDEVKNQLGSVFGAIKTYAAPVLALASAGEALNRVLRGSQTTSDALDASMRSLNTVVDSFFTAISTCDFSAFDTGITNMIQRARDANAALDQLGNTVISYDYLSGKNNAAFGEQIVTLRDKSATKEQKAEALKAAESIYNKQKEYTAQLVDTTIDAVKKVATETSGLLGSDMINIGDVERILELDVLKNRDSEKNKLANEYEELMAIREKYIDQFTVTQTMQSTSGAYSQNLTDWRKVNAAMSTHIEQYKDAILYNEILVKKDDDWLKSLTSNMSKANSARMGVVSMERQLVRAKNPLIENPDKKGGNKGNKLDEIHPTVIPDYPSVNSIAGWRDHISELQYQYEHATSESMRRGLREAIKEAKEELKKLEDGAEETKLLDDSVRPKRPNAHNDVLSKGRTFKFEEMPVIDNSDSIKSNFNLVDSLTMVNSALGSISGSTQEGAAAWLTYTANIISGVAAMLPSLASLFGIESALGISEQAKIPFPMNIIAMAATGAALIATIASIPKFADGGIFESALTTGDRNIARLNGGEMILNKGQQYNLFQLLDRGPSGLNTTGEIKVRIQGKDLVGVIGSYQNKLSKYV